MEIRPDEAGDAPEVSRAGGGADTAQAANDADGAEDAHPVTVSIARTGGFAGLRREWSITASDPASINRWVGLIDACPWGDTSSTFGSRSPSAPVMPDRFVYSVRVTGTKSARTREQRLAEPEFTGPWCELLDALKQSTAR